jgi:hypothetical protein
VGAFTVLVFESVDRNEVDLITGSLRVTTPALKMGTEHNKYVWGLHWSGKG